MHLVLLQITEATRTVTEAAGAATTQVGQQGPLFAVLWSLVLLLALISGLLYLKAERVSASTHRAAAEAVQNARAEWARQQAIDNGHAAEMLRQSREQEREALDRLDLINRELRQQEVKSVEVIGGVRTALTQLSTIMHGVQSQLQVIESLLSARPARPGSRSAFPRDNLL